MKVLAAASGTSPRKLFYQDRKILLEKEFIYRKQEQFKVVIKMHKVIQIYPKIDFATFNTCI